MTNYQIGARLERLWCDQMRKKGYQTMRSAGSKGLIDCIAWNDHETFFAQVKYNRHAYTKKDIDKLKAMKRPPSSYVRLYERFGAGGIEWNIIEC